VRIYFNFSLDTIVSYFWNPHAKFVYVTNIVSSFQKSIINSLFFKNLFIFFNILFSINYIATWIKNIFTMLALNMTLLFMFMMLYRKSGTMTIHFVPLIMLSPHYIYVCVLCVCNTIYMIY